MLYSKSFICLSFSLGIVAMLTGCAENPTRPHTETSNATELIHLTPGISLEELRETLPPGVSLRKTYAKGVQLTKSSEGFIDQAYDDPVGFCTIAYDHLIQKIPCKSIPLSPEFQGKITEPFGAKMLTKDMETAGLDLNRPEYFGGSNL